jgi:hypothetical protein
MSNRLKFFREQMAAFEGTVDPRQAIESGYYLPEPRKSAADTISRRIELRPSSTHLLIGGIGSGKTTQLLVMRDRINKLEDIYAHYVDVTLYTDISEISAGVLIAIAGVELTKLTQDIDNEYIKKYSELIHKYAYGYSDRRTVGLFSDSIIKALSTTTEVVEHHKGILTAKSGNSLDQQELLQAIGKLDKAANKKYGEIILLLDGLDRLDNVQKFSQLVTSDVQAISLAGIGIVLVGPLLAAYGSYRDIIEQAVNSFSYQSCFDVDNDPDACAFFESILKGRSSEGFIEESAIQHLIHYSGGVLRDLINLTQASIEEAYLSDSDNLQQVHVEAAMDSFGRAKLLGLSDSDINILEQVLSNNTFIPRTDEDIRLLVTGRILEYRYPQRRYVVHPTLEPLIQKIQSL